MIFSTVHRCKSMEYDEVFLADDFITEEKLEKQKDKKDKNWAKLNEEINLLYVAFTRTKNIVHIPESILPGGFTVTSPQIKIIKPIKVDEDPAISRQVNSGYTSKRLQQKLSESTGQSYFRAIREINKDAYMPWTNEQDEELTTLYCKGQTLPEMASHFSRTRGAIRARIKKLELEDLYG